MENKDLIQWEYKELVSSEVNVKNLNELGKQGWETAVVKPIGTVILKRPIIKDKN